MDLKHLTWPFFEPRHRDLAEKFRQWVSEHLSVFENDEGGDGKAARKIFQLLGDGGWLEHTLPSPAPSKGRRRFDLRSVCLLREISSYSSAIADVAFCCANAR
jgi:acyl-CoA dehydrogenase